MGRKRQTLEHELPHTGTISIIADPPKACDPSDENTPQTSLLVMVIDKVCSVDTFPSITFSTKDAKGIEPHDDDLVVTTVITVGFNVEKVLTDQGSSMNIIHWSVYKRMGTQEQKLQVATILRIIDRLFKRTNGDLEAYHHMNHVQSQEECKDNCATIYGGGRHNFVQYHHGKTDFKSAKGNGLSTTPMCEVSSRPLLNWHG